MRQNEREFNNYGTGLYHKTSLIIAHIIKTHELTAYKLIFHLCGVTPHSENNQCMHTLISSDTK